jgi:BirA family transcriptional regulator, biotin operon repressor / biotin---[acetyl-CoA-carboxylase] ligase
MLSQLDLEHVSARLGLASPVRFEEVTGSTNAVCAQLAAEGAPEWTVVAAGHQTAGRGRLRRAWLDRPGDALLVSVLLRPDVEAAFAGVIPLLAGVATVEAARRTAGVRAGCKWPNDVLVADRKAAGILAESAIEGTRVRHVVLGVGVNLGRPPEGIDGAGSIAGGSVGGADAASFLEAFLRAFRAGYRPADVDFAAAVLERYRRVCVSLGRLVRASTIAGDVVEGRAVDLDARGALVVRTPSGRRHAVALGDVHHLDAAS